jgi:hypothetical protein
MSALSPVKKGKCGVGGSRRRPCSWECYEKKWKHTVIQKYVFLEILINVKAGRVN